MGSSLPIEERARQHFLTMPGVLNVTLVFITPQESRKATEARLYIHLTDYQLDLPERWEGCIVYRKPV